MIRYNGEPSYALESSEILMTESGQCVRLNGMSLHVLKHTYKKSRLNNIMLKPELLLYSTFPHAIMFTYYHCTLSPVLIIYFDVIGKAIPLQAWTSPGVFRKVKAPSYHDNRHMKSVGLSALHTGCLYPPGNIPGTHFC